MRAIAAMSINRVIGKNGKLPWRIKEDLKFFKEKTSNSIIAMGRKTFESAGALPDRHIFVLSSSFPNQKFEEKIKVLEKKVRNCKITAINSISQIPNNAWICGGSSLYEQTLEFCTDLHLTFIDKRFNGDCNMPWFEGDFSLFTSERQLTESGITIEFRHYLNNLIYGKEAV